ncbi:MAG TPA: methylmalonyl Co-A mutase-associated GTPase MeaB [Gemmatimonadota bacterium]|nr:methylmalonyl Co-A mutase-associated GTPase MeaB [Gemmatimonadota bacterium]
MATTSTTRDGALDELLEAFARGDRRALARALSWVENQRPGFERLMDALHGRLGAARRLGVTGPPGAGKSTLTEKLALRMRERGEKVGILAVDPSSPYTGGALLGDRIRMQDLTLDEGAFIRSMASRGRLGGLATTSLEAADLLEAFGFDVVIHETVGVGQTERDIVSAADTTIVVLVPESGDSIQAMKAGLMEIADVFVVNKADRPGADRLERALKATLGLKAKAADGWSPPIVRTVATESTGLDALEEAIAAHRAHGEATGALARKRRERAEERVRDLVARRLEGRVWGDGAGERILAEGLDRIEAGQATPYSVADEIARATGLESPRDEAADVAAQA